MVSQEQIQKIGYLSDVILYHEAVAFLHRLINEEECKPLPTSQVTGLLNVARTNRFKDLTTFINHQCERDWPLKKQDLKIFYKELQAVFTTMRNKRLNEEFQLLTSTLSTKEANSEKDEIMALLAYDYIQHLLAENGIVAAKEKAKQQQARKEDEQRWQ